MDRFVRGTFCLDRDVVDLENWEQLHKLQLEQIGELCKILDIEFQCGLTEDNKYIIEYRVIAPTAQQCNSFYRELKTTLKEYFTKPEELQQFKGRLG